MLLHKPWARLGYIFQLVITSSAILRSNITLPSGCFGTLPVDLPSTATQGGYITKGKTMNSKLIVILIAGISLVGCTTMRPIDAQQSSLTQEVEVGDHLIAYEKSGRIVDMTVSVIDGDVLKGTLAENSHVPVEVDINDAEKIEVEKIDGVKTTLAVVGGAVVILPLALIAAMTGAMFQY
jgi:hypothetical protein